MKWPAAFLERIMDAVMPPRARSARTRERTVVDIPLSPTSHELLGVEITTLMDYRAREVDDLVRSLKYEGSRHAASLAATLLADYLAEEIAMNGIFSKKQVLLVPVPIHKQRLRERGYNQVSLVLDALPIEFKDGSLSRVRHHALVRTRATPQQTRFSRSERLSNVAGAFASAENDLSGSLIYLIDDVTTTGATLANAATPLRRAGARVKLLALARA